MGDSPTGANGHALRAAAEVDAHRRWLRTVIYARVGNTDAADDVLQDVLLDAVGEAPDVASPAGWLYRLAVRKSLLYRRKTGRERRRFERVLRESAGQQSQQEKGDPLEWLLADERAEQVRAALARLNNRERELLLLKYTEDWSYRQMAEHLGLSVSAVEARLHRARQRLRDQLRKLKSDE